MDNKHPPIPEQHPNHFQNQPNQQYTNQQHNPQPNMQKTEEKEHFGLLNQPRQNTANRGIKWLTASFGMFANNLGMWLISSLVILVTLFVSGLIPLGFLLMFHITAGVIVASAYQAEGYDFDISDLFSAFQSHLVPLLIMSVIYYLLILFIGIAFVITFSILGLSDVNNQSILLVALVTLISLALFIPLIMATYHAPALIVIHDIKPVSAMKMSLKGCFANFVPFFVYGIVAFFVFIFLTIFTLGIGLLFIYTIGMIAGYVSYRDIWSETLID